jgi:uncharacterized protein YwgA
MEFKGTWEEWKTYTYISENGRETTIVQNINYKGERTDIHVRFSAIEETEKETNKANALLISKAPKMLEMLIELSFICNLSDEKQREVNKLIKEATEL